MLLELHFSQLLDIVTLLSIGGGALFFVIQLYRQIIRHIRDEAEAAQKVHFLLSKIAAHLRVPDGDLLSGLTPEQIDQIEAIKRGKDV